MSGYWIHAFNSRWHQRCACFETAVFNGLLSMKEIVGGMHNFLHGEEAAIAVANDGYGSRLEPRTIFIQPIVLA